MMETKDTVLIASSITKALEVKDKIGREEAGHLEMQKDLDYLMIETQNDYDLAASVLKDLSARYKEIEEERTSVVKPLNDVVKKVNGWFKPFTENLDSLKKDIKQKMVVFLEKQKEAQQRALAAAADAGSAELLQTAVGLTVTSPKGISQVKTWKWRTVNEDLVPREHFILNHASIDAIVKLNKGKTEIPGIEVYEETQIRASSK